MFNIKNLTNYQPPQGSQWIGRSDGPEAKRFHEIIQCIDLRVEHLPEKEEKEAFALIGFACDEGIKRNFGRVGASLGPAAFRHAFAKLPVQKLVQMMDLGDMTCHDGNLEKAQSELGQLVAMILQCGIHPIVIGGGHELSWGQYLGLDAIFSEKDLVIVNFDAHFDLRPLIAGSKGSSGTSFLQMAQSRLNRGKSFQYVCFGIQEFGNTQALFRQAEQLHVKMITANQFHLAGTDPQLELLEEVIAKADMIYLTICLDVFATPFAPGVSSPQPLGLFPWHLIPLIKLLRNSGKVVSFDIAELSPPYDIDHRTSHLAASLVANFIN